jgi:hypothetical protein
MGLALANDWEGDVWFTHSDLTVDDGEVVFKSWPDRNGHGSHDISGVYWQGYSLVRYFGIPVP